jgi:serine/threonine protein kinase
VDLWSLGILLFEMVHGFTPFYADEISDIYNKIIKSDIGNFTDKKYLNVLKQNAMSRRLSGGGRLSHPLPIKYSFTIIGKSGIRRGDTFNIIGIPRKYAACGLFQVTEVEQTIQDMKWVTRVQGEYRQQQ